VKLRLANSSRVPWARRGGQGLVEPEMVVVARWAAAGLTAYDAAYVAVAEQTGSPLITGDPEILRLAGAFATPLVP
jgi:predicted nucleic acid-binding protein